ncbi:unnamed protein product [Brassica rapa]|uniref:F-box domain-containing protein n=1 Tax=Brassica campestris TaxID=3711 RepID=A0A8D9G6U3_BRACM|nr:unnamed protein product [Brassica rapa]
MMSKDMAKINKDMLMLRDDQTPKVGASLSQSKRRKISIVGIKPNIPDLNVKPCYDSDEGEKGEVTNIFQNLAGLKSHDGCYVNHKLLYELEVEIFARLPCFEYWKLQFLNKKFLQLLKSGEIFRVRQEKGLVKPYVILHSGAGSNWEMFDKDFKTFQRLPKVPSSDYCFFHSDKETICVGTQLIVIGREIEGIVVFRYELENHKWFKGPSMITPRVMYVMLLKVLFWNLQKMMSKDMAKINQDMLMLRDDQTPKVGASLSQSKRRKISIVGIKPNIPDLNVKPCYDSDEGEKGEVTNIFQNLAGLKSHDGCYVHHKLLYELEVEIFARLPCFEYWKLQFLNKKFLQLLKSGEIFRVRQEKGLVKPYVILHSGAGSNWEMFDKDFKTFQRLPKVPSSDYCFFHSDKETICVGTQLIVIGREIEGIVVFRYEPENHKWFKGPSMITPRVMYGSASHGKTAFFAGGIQMDDNGNPIVVRTVEKYNADAKSWTMINGMHKARKFSSGCFLRGKFYVLGGRDENDKHLTCGESYDETRNSWELIPDMLKDMTFITPSQSPPLIAVVDDNLYMLETSLNELRLYDINTNIWKKLGVVPVSTNTTFGWVTAFKSMGDRLLVVGSSHSWHRKGIVYSCRPSPDVEEQHWEELKDWRSGAKLPHRFKEQFEAIGASDFSS